MAAGEQRAAGDRRSDYLSTMPFLTLPFFLFFFSCTFSLLVRPNVAALGFFSWPSDWVVVNNASLPSADAGYKAMNGPFRAVVASSGEAIFSENGTFALGFLNLNSTGNFLLCVAMAVGFRTPPGAELWSANRNRPVKENATLRIGALGNLILLDWDGTEVWNSGEGIVHAIAMQEFGDLEFYNTTNASTNSKPVWRSWVSPIQHTLVQGQGLPTGSKLVSNVSAGNSSEGLYSLSMEPGGIVLYVGSGSNKVPYWIKGFIGLEDYQSILQPCFLNASSGDPTSTIVFSGGYLDLYYSGASQNGTALCPAINTSSSITLDLGPNVESMFQFMRLDDDGNLRSYLMSAIPGQGSTNEWAVNFELFPKGSARECRLPNVCGPLGICSSGQCSCPGSGSADAFMQVHPLDSTAGCLPPRPLVCNENSSVDQHFLKLEGVDYFLNSFSTPEEEVSTVEECERRCSNNCSCDAFFFYTDSGSCFQVKELKSLLVVPNSTFEAYLKVQNAPVIAQPSPAGNIPSSPSRSLSSGGIVGITIGAASVLSLLFLLILIRRRTHGLDFIDPNDQEEAAFLEALPGLPPRFTLKELQTATKQFKKKLGAGGFGSVYEGVLKDGSKVAVKRLNAARQGHKEFRAEVATIGSINHVNLVRLRGFCAEKGERLLIYELIPNGSLEKWIFRDKGKDVENQLASSHVLSWEMRLSIAIGTAKGLAYLHEDCREAILHLDIKPQNILVGDKFVPKVADFGMSRLMDGEMSQVVTVVRGTPGYLAPEWIRACIATKKCDVYSFGMVLLELIGGRRNFDPTLGSDPSVYYFPTWAKLRALEGKYMDLLDDRIKGKVTSDEEQQQVIRMSKVAFCCIHENPLMRPTMGAIVNMLEGNDTNIPTLAALGLTNVGSEEGEFTQGSSWALLSSEASATISNNDISGPR